MSDDTTNQSFHYGRNPAKSSQDFNQPSPTATWSLDDTQATGAPRASLTPVNGGEFPEESMGDGSLGKVSGTSPSDQGSRDEAYGSSGARLRDEAAISPPAATPVSSGLPERGPVRMAEALPLVEVREYDVPLEVQEYVEKVEKDQLELGEAVVHEGIPVVQPLVSVEDPRVILPLTQVIFDQGMKSKVSTSVRWLAEWCFRIIKKFKGQTAYLPEKSK